MSFFLIIFELSHSFHSYFFIMNDNIIHNFSIYPTRKCEFFF